jgi:hypothetical protein
MEKELPIIRSGVDLSEINFFHEEEENLRARSDAPIVPEATFDPIEEGSGSSGAPSKTESSEEQHIKAPEPTSPKIEYLKSLIPKKTLPPLPITREPSQFSKRQPTRSSKPNLGAILSPKERKKAPEPSDSGKRPSDDTDLLERDREFQEVPKVRKVPKVALERRERVLKLEGTEFGRGSRTPRLPRQRGSFVPELEQTVHSEEAQQLDSNFPNLPQLPEELFNFDAIETLLDPEADEAKIQTILSGAREGHEISSEFMSQKDIEPTPHKKDLNEIAQELDEFKKEVILTLRPEKRTEHARPSNVASQILAPATSKKMAETVRNLIESTEGDRPRSFRVLNILLCAAGGTIKGNAPMICAPIMYPETDDCALKLLNTPDAKRYDYIKALFDQLSPHLTDEQVQLVRDSLTYIYSATYAAKIPQFIESEINSFRKNIT